MQNSRDGANSFTKVPEFSRSPTLALRLAPNRLFAFGEPLGLPDESTAQRGGGERLNSGDVQRISKEFCRDFWKIELFYENELNDILYSI